MKKLLPVIILCILLLASCKANSGQSTAQGQTVYPTEITLTVNEGDASFIIIRPELTSQHISESLSGLSKTLSENQAADKVMIYDDTRKENPEVTELLVGATNRSASVNAISGLKYGEFTVGIYEGKFVMAGYDDDATLDAINYFYSHYFDFVVDGKITADRNYISKNQYPYSAIMLGDSPISQYTIVYPDPGGQYTEKDSNEKYAATRLNEMISQLCGVTLPVENAATTTAQKCIRLVSGGGEDYGYSVKNEGEGYSITASRVYAYTQAFKAMLTGETVGGELHIPKELALSSDNSLVIGKSDEFVYVSYHNDEAESDTPPVSALKINSNDISKYKIVYHDYGKGYLDLGMNEIGGAQELQAYLKYALGIELPLVTDNEPESEYEILVGNTNRHTTDTSAYGDEGFVIKTVGNKLIICGGEARGTLYGVYTFLEEYIGYRFYSDDCEVCYRAKEINIPPDLYDEQLPNMEFRDVCQKVMHTSRYASKRKINSNFYRTMSFYQGSNYRFAGGQYVHTMGTVFDLSDSSRQPCLSSEEVYEKALEKARYLMKMTPTAEAISITQNDNNNCCTCQTCSQINYEEGSKAGTLIRFINRLAEVFKEEYPDTKILTLAYMYSYAAPKTAPLDNVIIEICCLDACCNHGLGDLSCSTNAEFRRNIKDWSALTDNLYVWYYAVAFTGNSIYAPFMNFEGIYDTYQFFNSYGVKGVFNEGWMNGESHEFGELRAYILSKLMWDKDMTKAEYYSEIEAFIDAYYGEGAELVKEYFYLMQDLARGRHYEQYTGIAGIFDKTRYGIILGELIGWWQELTDYEYSREATQSHINRLAKGFNEVKKFMIRT